MVCIRYGAWTAAAAAHSTTTHTVHSIHQQYHTHNTDTHNTGSAARTVVVYRRIMLVGMWDGVFVGTLDRVLTHQTAFCSIIQHSPHASRCNMRMQLNVCIACCRINCNGAVGIVISDSSDLCG